VSDHAAPTAPRSAARRPTLGKTVLRVAAVAATATALVFSGLFYGAARKDAAPAAPPTPRVAPTRGSAHAAPTVAPVTTRTS
jgi:hypothetical protein